MFGHHTTPSTAPSGKNLNLEYLFYNYILKMESFYPGVLLQISESTKNEDDDSNTQENTPHEKKPTHYTIGNRLFFTTLEISTPENQEECLLAPLADEINTVIKKKRHHSLLKGLYKSIEAIEPSLTLETIKQVVAIQNTFIGKLLTPDYIKQLNIFLATLIPEEHAREHAEKTIYNAIFFRCLAHTFTLKTSSSKKTAQRKFKQKFLTEIYAIENNDISNLLITMICKTKEKIVSALETNHLNDILEGNVKTSKKMGEKSSETTEESEKSVETPSEKSESSEEKTIETPFIRHVKQLSRFINSIETRYEFIIDPLLTISYVLNHLYALATHLQKKTLPIDNNEVKSLTSIVITFIESHIATIKADDTTPIKTETIIKTIKEIAVTEESEALEKLQSHLEPHLKKIKLSINTPKQTRPPMPTNPSITFFKPLKKTKPQNNPDPERTMLIPKK